MSHLSLELIPLNQYRHVSSAQSPVAEKSH